MNTYDAPSIYYYYLHELENYNVTKDLGISFFTFSLSTFEEKEYNDKVLHFHLFDSPYTKYDLVFANNEILLNNRKHFLNLYDYLPKEHIEMYNSEILPISDNKLYGLVNINIYIYIFKLKK